MACYCGSCWKHDSNGETAESLSAAPAQAFCEGVKTEEDVRATRKYRVGLTILVEAEDARKAVEKMLFGYDGTGLEVLYVSASEEEDRR